LRTIKGYDGRESQTFARRCISLAMPAAYTSFALLTSRKKSPPKEKHYGGGEAIVVGNSLQTTLTHMKDLNWCHWGNDAGEKEHPHGVLYYSAEVIFRKTRSRDEGRRRRGTSGVKRVSEVKSRPADEKILKVFGRPLKKNQKRSRVT